MKFCFATTVVLGTLCILQTNQTAKATLADSLSPNIYLARMGAHGGYRGEEIREEATRAEEESHREESEMTSKKEDASQPSEETPLTSKREDHIHTLQSDKKADPSLKNTPGTQETGDRLHTEKKNTDTGKAINRYDRGWTGVDWGNACDVTDINGNCMTTPPTVSPSTPD